MILQWQWSILQFKYNWSLLIFILLKNVSRYFSYAFLRPVESMHHHRLIITHIEKNVVLICRFVTSHHSIWKYNNKEVWPPSIPTRKSDCAFVAYQKRISYSPDKKCVPHFPYQRKLLVCALASSAHSHCWLVVQALICLGGKGEGNQTLKEKMESFWPKKLSNWRNLNSTRDSD